MRPRFLISRLSALGDVACTLPVASAIKVGFPDAEVVWAVDRRFAGIVECCDAVDEIVVVRPGFTPASWPRISGTFEAALDMQGLMKSALPVALAKAKTKAAYHWQREGSRLFASGVRPDPSSWHVVDQYVDVARSVGGLADRAEFRLRPKEDDLSSIEEKLADLERFVVMNTGAGWITKRWPPEHFASLIDRAAADGLPTVLIGGNAKADVEAAKEVEALCQSSPISLVGKTSVRELVALLSLAKAHVGGDTGSSHISAALGIPAVGLYSITKPERSCPYGQIDRCHYHPDGLVHIAPEAVYETLREALV
jgi:heptosyltransferase I